MPRFLSVARVLQIHARVIDKYGGSHGVRDLGLLESAVAMPQAGFGDDYMHGSLVEMAAAYLYHLAQNHPFVDGNKRAALAAALSFLKLNGVTVMADQDEITEIVLGVARGEISKSEVAVYLKSRAT
jgi:death-on-curing protein